MIKNRFRGITTIEIVVAISIAVILLTIIIGGFTSARSSQALKAGTQSVASIMEDARSRAIFARDDISYGIRFTTNGADLFGGSTFSTSSIVKSVELDPHVTINSILLSDGSSEVVFEKRRGNASATGSVDFLHSSTNATTTINIYGTGAYEITP